MSNSIVTSHKLQRLIGAAANIQSLMHDGTLPAAWGEGDADQVHAAVTAFDALTDAADKVRAEQRAASPFLLYRREIMAATPAGMALRFLVMSLYGRQAVPLRDLIEHFGDHEKRIAIECITCFTINGDRDSQFMSLGIELVEDACNEASEVAA